MKSFLKWAGSAVGGLLVLGQLLPSPPPPPPPPPSPSYSATIPSPTSVSPLSLLPLQGKVIEVVDGDTIKVDLGDSIETVRLIGVDTPETKHPTVPVECYGPEASEFTRDRLQGERIALELDVQSHDRYDRLLAYVWVGDELFNETLVENGYAVVATYPPNVKYVDRFLDAQESAESDSAGQWGSCGMPPSLSPSNSVSEAGGGGSATDCDPSYPTVCIPPYEIVGDLNCPDVPYNNFKVLPPDPHQFDGEHDGLGCES